MNLIALLLGLGIERLFTRSFHLREARWLDPLLDEVLRRVVNASQATTTLALIVLAAVIVLPIALISVLLADLLLQIPYFLFAIVVLLFSLGPRDLKEEVDDYCTAVENNDVDNVRRVARELLEEEAPGDAEEQTHRVERAVYVQANNRIFGVVFWFLLLGPTGAWLFRVLDLMRHGITYRHDRQEEQPINTTIIGAVRTLHGILAYLPARLLAVGYALAGSFEDAISDWSVYYRQPALRFYERSNDVVGCVGLGAGGHARQSQDQTAAARVRGAMNLVIRTLWLIWCPVIAILTLFDLLT
jgi:AmpE protein